jgi:hypothetical protein
MKAFRTFVFYLGLGLLFTHELDAIVQGEWRLLYVLRSLPDEQAMPLFVALHVPLFALTFVANVDLRSRIVRCAVSDE